MSTPMNVVNRRDARQMSIDSERDFDTGAWLLLLQVAGSITLLINRALRLSNLNLDTWLLLETVHGQTRRPSELARAVGGPRGSVSRRIARLEEQGLVSIRLSLDDRRVKSVSITPDGVRVLETARGHIESVLAPVSDWVDDTERGRVTDYHRQLLKIVRNRMYGCPA